MTRVPSYQKIDYSLRPAKAIERKMMVDALRRLDRMVALKHYRYVGFGSPYFTDFSLFHKALDLTALVSIEREIEDEDRFRFNVPYAAIELRFGESTDVLPEIDWQQRSIVWLDYDEKLSADKLTDVAYLSRELQPGSVLIVTVNVHPHSDLETRLERTREDLGPRLPRRYSAEELGGWGTASAARDVISEEIEVALAERNTGKPESTRVGYRQLFNFNYRDGARMLTVGGVFFDAGIDAHIDGCGFSDFDFFRDGADPYEIVVPRLTLKEMRHLDTLLPAMPLAVADGVGLSQADVETYARVYRYFPRFADIDS